MLGPGVAARRGLPVRLAPFLPRRPCSSPSPSSCSSPSSSPVLFLLILPHRGDTRWSGCCCCCSGSEWHVVALIVNLERSSDETAASLESLRWSNGTISAGSENRTATSNKPSNRRRMVHPGRQHHRGCDHPCEDIRSDEGTNPRPTSSRESGRCATQWLCIRWFQRNGRTQGDGPEQAPTRTSALWPSAIAWQQAVRDPSRL